MTSRDKKIVAGIAATVVLSVLFVGVRFLRRRKPTREIWESVGRGMRESSVRALLGTPSHEYTQVDAPSGHYFANCGQMKLDISGKVLIYLEKDLVLYIYFDTAGRVEETVIASNRAE